MGIFRVGIVWVGVILDENFLCWAFSGWKLSGENHPDGNFLGGSFPSTELDDFSNYGIFGYISAI